MVEPVVEPEVPVELDPPGVGVGLVVSVPDEGDVPVPEGLVP